MTDWIALANALLLIDQIEVIRHLRLGDLESRTTSRVDGDLVATCIDLASAVTYVSLGPHEHDLMVAVPHDHLAQLPLGQHNVVFGNHIFGVLRTECSFQIGWTPKRGLKSSHRELAPSFWENAWILDDRASAISDNWLTLTRVTASAVELAREDLARHWPEHYQIENLPLRKRGPKPKYNWSEADDFLASVVDKKWIKQRGYQAKLERKLADWFAGQAKHPSVSQIRQHVSEWLRQFGR